MTRLSTLGSCLLLAAACNAPLQAADEPRRPNVVVILADDQGWGDLSIHGNTNLRTPRIDSLAHDGAQFEQFFVCPVCSPTRAEFLTGRWHPRGGVHSTSTGGERLDLDERTIAQVFAEAGYATGAFGKWHSGTQWPYHPKARGFAEYFGFTSGHWGDYFDAPLEHNGEPIVGRGFIADAFTDAALAFIEEHRGGPFFCYLPFNTPHSPLQVPDRFYDRFANAPLALRHRDPEKEDLAETRAVLAMVENIDWNVGRLLDKLTELNLARDTIVVYFSDNGPNGWRWNAEFRGRKGSVDEGGVRSPCLVRWPAAIAPGTRIASIAGAVDLLPTLADLAQIELHSTNPLDGTSQAALLRGENTAAPDRLIFSHWAGKVSVRSQRYRLDDQGRLYDMTDDPGQRNDIARAQPEVARELSAAVARWKAELLPGLTDDDRPFPVGYRAFPLAVLPARDAVPHGTIERSARAPNCSYLRHWTNLDDRITWDVEVATAGRYEATLYYTCAPQNVGAVVELSFGDASISNTITEAHDPPARGAEHDRYPRRGESLVKDFRPLVLGQLDLPARRAPLTLRALAKPGPEVIEIRGVSLRLEIPNSIPGGAAASSSDE